MDLESRSVCDLLGVSFMTLFLLVYYVPETIQLQRSLKGTMIQGQSHLAVLIMTHINNLKQRRSSDPRGRNQMRVRPLVIVSSKVQTEKLEVHSCTNSTPPLCCTFPPVCTCTQYTFINYNTNTTHVLNSSITDNPPTPTYKEDGLYPSTTIEYHEKEQIGAFV